MNLTLLPAPNRVEVKRHDEPICLSTAHDAQGSQAFNLLDTNSVIRLR